jgi:exosortase
MRWSVVIGGGILAVIAGLPLIKEWHGNSNCGHVALTLPLALAVLLIQLRNRDTDQTNTTDAHRSATIIGIALLVIAWGLLAGRAIINEATLLAAGLWMGLGGCILMLGGWSVLRRGAWGWVLLAFAVPPPQAVTQCAIHLGLQRLTADAAAGLAGLMGIAATADHTTIRLGGEQLAVAEPCSGFRFIIALTFAALLMAAVQRQRRILTAMAGIPIALVIAVAVNAMRITIALLLMHADSPARAERFLHGPGVWMVYAGGTVVLLMAVRSIHGLSTVKCVTQQTGSNMPWHGDTAWC